MSLDATRWAWQQKLRPSLKLVLLSFADRADENHCAYPSVPRLEKDTGLDPKTIRKARQELAEMGLISDTGRTVKRCPIYRLNGVQGRDDPSQKREGLPLPKTAPTKSGPLPKVDPSPLPLLDPDPSQKWVTEPTNESIRESTRGRERSPPNESLNNLGFPECDQDAFEGFLAYRARRGKPNDPNALYNTANLLRPLSLDDRNWLLRQAVAEGHVVIYPRMIEDLPSKRGEVLVIPPELFGNGRTS